MKKVSYNRVSNSYSINQVCKVIQEYNQNFSENGKPDYKKIVLKTGVLINSVKQMIHKYRTN